MSDDSDSSRYTSVKEQIEYGLDSIDPKLMLSIPARDFMYVYNTFRELYSFFHQPDHYLDLASIHEFLGGLEDPKAALIAIHRCYYHILPQALPDELSSAIEEDEVFTHPDPPYYHKPRKLP